MGVMTSDLTDAHNPVIAVQPWPEKHPIPQLHKQVGISSKIMMAPNITSNGTLPCYFYCLMFWIW